MAHTPGMKHGAWCHIEIPTASPEAAKRFYGGLLGWTFTDSPVMKYTLYSTGKGEIGGGMFDPPPGAPRQITNYVTVDDLDAAVGKVEGLGGRVVSERTEVPPFGWFRIVSDPDGNAIGLWQSMPPPAAPKAKKKATKRKGKRR
ncbi:MAG TPA: VOC family protein [Planctomycetota bacterium]|nr:VOC family protein [Planctomycetota bacterium]